MQRASSSARRTTKDHSYKEDVSSLQKRVAYKFIFSSYYMDLVSEFTSPEQLIEVWLAAKETGKAAKAQEDLCKRGALALDVPLDTIITNGYGLTSKSRNTYSVPREVVREYFGDKEPEFLIVDKKKFDDFLAEKLEAGTITEEMIAEIKAKYVVENSSSWYEVKNFNKQS